MIKMRYALTLLTTFLFVTRLFAQKLPMEHLVDHLIKAGELAPQKSWQGAAEKVAVNIFLESDRQGLYSFSSKSTHYYNFLLLRNDDSFYIFNANNFIEEYGIISGVLSSTARDSFHEKIVPVIRLYEHNYNYHPTPPILDITAGRKSNQKKHYLPRKLPHTKPFLFKK